MGKNEAPCTTVVHIHVRQKEKRKKIFDNNNKLSETTLGK
jgi:hypothetical protein